MTLTPTDTIKARRPDSRPPRANRTAPHGRFCAEPRCGTPLSIYNLQDRCGAHEQRRFLPPTVRGYIRVDAGPIGCRAKP